MDELTGPQSDVVRPPEPPAAPAADVPAPRDPSGYYQVPVDPTPTGE
jgi:hypothetical protein